MDHSATPHDSVSSGLNAFSFQHRGQDRLYEVLTEANEGLGHMYLGGHRVLLDLNNPDRFAQSANSFRELMEKAPAYIAVPEKERYRPLKPEVDKIHSDWKKTKQQSTMLQSSVGWSGNVDDSLRTFLTKLDDFFTNFENNNKPTRGGVYTQLQRSKDPSDTPIPSSVEKMQVKEWSKLNRYFHKVTHHGKIPKQVEFEKQIECLEQILIAILIPQTSFDQRELKKEIEALEGK